jgi:hypothetical protein
MAGHSEQGQENDGIRGLYILTFDLFSFSCFQGTSFLCHLLGVELLQHPKEVVKSLCDHYHQLQSASQPRGKKRFTASG